MWPIIILFHLLACNNQGNCCGNREECCCWNNCGSGCGRTMNFVRDCDCDCDCNRDCDCDHDHPSKPFPIADDDCGCNDDCIQPRGFYNGTIKS